MGAAYGTWKSAVGLATIANLPSKAVGTEMVMKSIMPVILSGVCGIFGLIIAVIISSTCAAALARGPARGKTFHVVAGPGISPRIVTPGMSPRVGYRARCVSVVVVRAA